MKIWQKVLIIVVCVFLFISVGGFVAYKIFGGKVLSILYASRPGNGKQYDVSKVKPDQNSPLRGKTILFLGSSVTEGHGSGGVSFVEYLEKKDGVNVVKNAKGGTTLIDNGDDSYVARMKKMDTAIQADAFVVQLSTNDATREAPLGSVSEGRNRDDFDTSTVAGAIEYIIAYAGETWNCPVVFYTNTRYDSAAYEKMVSLLSEIQEKWGCGVIDLWNDEELNAASDADHDLYMIDNIHPTKAGYLLWLPVIEEYLGTVVD